MHGEKLMATRLPSMKVLLALLAIAGYRNRDKIGEFIKNATAEGGPLAEAKKQIGEGAAGTTIKQGLEELKKQFDSGGQGDKSDSWIATGPNKPVTEAEVEKGVGPDLVGELARQLGLSRDDLLGRLKQVLPEAVDKMTPEGRIPA
jgi:uncharacterized protein YidB (DUF937 family)